MKTRRFWIWLAVVTLAGLLSSMQSACAATLTLPANTRIIEEEAFSGSRSLEEVILPEGITRIESLGFSNSSVSRVYFPESLEFIAEDAFDGSRNVTGYGLPGIYAQKWCNEHSVPYNVMETPVEEFTFTYPNAVEATLTGWTGTGWYVTIPESPDGVHTVTSIANNVFKGKADLRIVSFPDTVEKIGDSVFQGCTGLTQISLPQNLVSLGYSAFNGCANLTDVIFNDGLQTIGNAAFMNCTSLLEADLPDSVQTLGTTASYGVFQGCISLNSVHYPLQLEKATTSDGHGLFKDCVNLTDIVIQEGVETLAERFFENANETLRITLPSTLITIGNKAFHGCIKLTEIRLPESLNTIRANAFTGCIGLTQITLPSGLETIGYQAFSNCVNLEDVAFNDGLLTIDNGAFMNCTALLDADLPDSVQTLGTNSSYGVFQDCTSLASAHYPSNLEKVTVSGSYGNFMNCVNLKEVSIQEGVENLTGKIFQNANELISVNLPSTLETIGQSAFEGCVKMPAIILPDAVYDIGASAFKGCTGITRIALPSSLETLGYQAFSDCTNLADVVFNDGLMTIDNGAFMNCTALLDADLPDSVQILGANNSYGVFQGCTSLKSAHYPENLEKITISGSYGNFMDCVNLTEVTIQEGIVNLVSKFFLNANEIVKVNLPATLETIGQSAFEGCVKMPEINLPASVNKIDSLAFKDCTGLTEVTLPDNLETLGREAFAGCANLVDVVFNDGLVTIDNGAFMNCTALLDADLPDSVQILGTNYSYGVFQGCTSLAAFHYPRSLDKISISVNNGTFKDCIHLTDVTIPEGVSTLFTGLLRYCTGLQNLSLPSSLRTIENEALRGCTALRELTLPEGVTSIGTTCFRDCSNLRYIYIPLSVTSIGKNAFQNTHHNFEIETEYGAEAVTYAQNNSHKYYYLSLTGYHLPSGTLYLGYDFTLYGYVRSTLSLTDVHASITDSSGKVIQSVQLSPKVTDYNLSSVVAGELNISQLPLGNYTFTIGAATSKSSEEFYTRSFKIVEAPLMVTLSGYNVTGDSILRGTEMIVSGRVQANYPITRVAIRVTPDGGSSQDTAAAPGTKTYQLSDLNCDLGALNDGFYSVSVVVQGHGETREVGISSVAVGSMTLPNGQDINESKLKTFLGNSKNVDYFLNNYNVASFALNVTAHVDTGTNFNLVLSKYDAAVNGFVRGLMNTIKTGEDKDVLAVESYKLEISSFVVDLGEAGISLYDFNRPAAEKVMEKIAGGEKLTLTMVKDAYGTLSSDELSYFNNWIAVFENVGDIYDVITLSDDLKEMYFNSIRDYSQGLAVLDALSNNSTYTGKDGVNYQTAIRELREEFASSARSFLSQMTTYVSKEIVKKGIKQVTTTLLGDYANPYALATLCYNLLGDLGFYDDADDYVTYILRERTYENALQAYKEAFNAAKSSKAGYEEKKNLAVEFEMTRLAGVRTLSYLYELCKKNYSYTKGIDVNSLADMLSGLSTLTCPFLD